MIKGGPCGALQLLFELFGSHNIFSLAQVWHSHFFGLGHDCQKFKILSQQLETIALVQVLLNLKRAIFFVVAKIGQTNFGKSRKIQGLGF